MRALGYRVWNDATDIKTNRDMWHRHRIEKTRISLSAGMQEVAS